MPKIMAQYPKKESTASRLQGPLFWALLKLQVYGTIWQRSSYCLGGGRKCVNAKCHTWKPKVLKITVQRLTKKAQKACRTCRLIPCALSFLATRFLGLGSYNHKVGYHKRGLWYEPTGTFGCLSDTWRLLCSSLLVLAAPLIRDGSIVPKKELRGVCWYLLLGSGYCLDQLQLYAAQMSFEAGTQVNHRDPKPHQHKDPH